MEKDKKELEKNKLFCRQNGEKVDCGKVSIINILIG